MSNRLVTGLSALAALAGCGSKTKADDGDTALRAFREFVTATYSEKVGDKECAFRVDVRATNAVAEPWEGLLHAEIFVLMKDGKRNSSGTTFDAVFDRAGAVWTCSSTKSTSANRSMEPCETIDRFCRPTQPTPGRKDNSRPAEATTPPATTYPRGWEDLPPYGEALVKYAEREWGCVNKRLPPGELVMSCTFCRNAFRFGCAELSIMLRTASGTALNDRARSATLTFTAARQTGYAEALADVQVNSKRPPDAMREHSEEVGIARRACWHDKESTTSLESAYVFVNGSIVKVTARDPQRCAE